MEGIIMAQRVTFTLERLIEDLNKLTEWVNNPADDRLKSYSEKCMIAIAAKDQTRAPESIKEMDSGWMEAAWAELDNFQQAVIERYRWAIPTEAQAEKEKPILLKIGATAANLSQAVEQWKEHPNEEARLSMYDEIQVIYRQIQQLKKADNTLTIPYTG